MPPRVIGKVKSAELHRACPHCGVAFAYLPTDVVKCEEEDRPAGRETLTCPSCSREIVLRAW